MTEKWRKLFAPLFAAAALAASAKAGAVEVFGYGGPMTHTAIGGCCQSAGSNVGGGFFARFALSRTGELEIGAYSDGQWSEGYALKPFSLIGSGRSLDLTADPLISAQSVSDWRWILSLGAGYFSHNSRTVKFDLPVLVDGFEAVALNQLIYHWDERLMIGALLQANYAYNPSETSFMLGTFLTVGYYLP